MIEQDLISADLRTHTDPELDEKVEALQLCLRSAKAKLEAVETETRKWKREECSAQQAVERIHLIALQEQGDECVFS